MTELEETWTEKSFYDKPLSVWLGETRLDEEDFLPLDIFTAASIGCCQRVKDVINGDPKSYSYKNIGGWTALMYAAYYAHTDVIKALLDGNASVHPRNNSGCNALMLAVMCGNELVVELLIKCGSILETRDNRDWTALFHAVNSGHHNVVDLLIKYGVNLNSCERGTGLTPLMYGGLLGDAGVVESLLRGGAVPSLTNHQGHSAARIAQDAGYSAVASCITQWGIQGLEGPSLTDGPAAMEARRPPTHQSQMHKPKVNNIPSVEKALVQPTDLETLLDQVGLKAYMNIFKEQDVDLQIFLTLTDQDLKECGIQKLGPRRKMTSAIARWHSNAPLRSTTECAYADKLEVEMQELGVKLTEALESLQQAKAQTKQEHDLRVVTEGWVVEARGRLHQCHTSCRTLSDQVTAILHHPSLLALQPPPSLPLPGTLQLLAHPFAQQQQPSLSPRSQSSLLPHSATFQPPIRTHSPTSQSLQFPHSPTSPSSLHPHSPLPTALDTLQVIAGQLENLLALTDPSVPRGLSNPPSPRKQVQ